MSLNILTFLIRTSGLFLFWILLSGKLAMPYLLEGLFCALAIAYFSLSESPYRHPFRDVIKAPLFLIRFVLYLLWLLGRITLAAMHVSKLILNPRLPIAPKLIRHKSTLKSEFEKVIFANSITLTPGTITADISGDELTVHRLDEISSADIESKAIEKQIRKIFKS